MSATGARTSGRVTSSWARARPSARPSSASSRPSPTPPPWCTTPPASPSWARASGAPTSALPPRPARRAALPLAPEPGDSGRIRVVTGRDARKNRRYRGEDIRQGDVVLGAGPPRGPAQRGVLASTPLARAHEGDAGGVVHQGG